MPYAVRTEAARRAIAKHETRKAIVEIDRKIEARIVATGRAASRHSAGRVATSWQDADDRIDDCRAAVELRLLHLGEVRSNLIGTSDEVGAQLRFVLFRLITASPHVVWGCANFTNTALSSFHDASMIGPKLGIVVSASCSRRSRHALTLPVQELRANISSLVANF